MNEETLREKITYEIEYLVHELNKPIGGEEVIINREACINTIMELFHSHATSLIEEIEKKKVDIQKIINPSQSSAGQPYPGPIDSPNQGIVHTLEGFNQGLSKAIEVIRRKI